MIALIHKTIPMLLGLYLAVLTEQITAGLPVNR